MPSGNPRERPTLSLSNETRQRLRDHRSKYSTLSKNEKRLEQKRNLIRAAYYADDQQVIRDQQRTIGELQRTIGELKQTIRDLHYILKDCRSQNGVLGAVVKGVVSRSKRLGNYLQSWDWERRVAPRTTG